MASDNNGNVWIANCGSDSVTMIPDGNAYKANHFDDLGIKGPFGIAVDAKGNAWVAGNISNNVAAVGPDGTPLPGSPFTDKSISFPFGIALDSLGNVWLANNATIPICARGNIGPQEIIDALNERGHRHGKPSVVALGPDGKPLKGSPYKGGGIDLPWGIAVDGGDHVWVANFNGQRVVELCGARPETCPPGFRTGQGISPRIGLWQRRSGARHECHDRRLGQCLARQQLEADPLPEQSRRLWRRGVRGAGDAGADAAAGPAREALSAPGGACDIAAGWRGLRDRCGGPCRGLRQG